jgi:hypothetical protein
MMRLMSPIDSALDSVTDSTRLRYKINYPQKLWISRGLTNLEGNDRSGLEVDWLFFAQCDYVTDSRYHTETYSKYERG